MHDMEMPKQHIVSINFLKVGIKQKKLLYMKNFIRLLELTFVSLFAFVSCDKSNDNISMKNSATEKETIEECYCVKSDEGELLSLHLCKMPNGLVQIDVEPIEGDYDAEISKAIIVSDCTNLQDGELAVSSCPTKKRYIFDATLGSLSAGSQKGIIPGGGSGIIPGPSIQLNCICSAPNTGGRCIPTTVSSGNTTTYTCNSSIELPCKVSDAEACVIEYRSGKGDSEISSVTKLIIDCDSLIYNGVSY